MKAPGFTSNGDGLTTAGNSLLGQVEKLSSGCAPPQLTYIKPCFRVTIASPTISAASADSDLIALAARPTAS